MSNMYAVWGQTQQNHDRNNYSSIFCENTEKSWGFKSKASKALILEWCKTTSVPDHLSTEQSIT